MVKRKYTPIPFTDVSMQDMFWKPRIDTNRTVTLPAEYGQCKTTGHIDALDPDWRPAEGQQNRHIFWDSDLAKWIEAAAYSLATQPDPEVEKQVDHCVDLMEKTQLPDGYMNSYFVHVAPEKRWTNLCDWHELYCAGHLIEAAVAYFQATGKRKFLDLVCRYADHIDATFGREPGKKRGYCGHEEIELALVKLYHTTGNERYLKLSKYFVDERGTKPLYFHVEAIARGEDPEVVKQRNYDVFQAQIPLREQTKVMGHAVRAMYIYCAMADLAGETQDQSLLDACERLWANLCERNMYITGGIGSTASYEGFTFDYDLPNETAYAETCANIGLVFWNHRMLQLDCDSKYADVMERALYNGVLSGVSLDGKKFFYANPLASRGGYGRSDWFGCACCPPNIARLIASIGQYVYSTGDGEAVVHLYAQGKSKMSVNGTNIVLKQKTEYPWDGHVQIVVEPERDAEFTLKLRIPGWCRNAELSVNGEAVELREVIDKGYASIKRKWSMGDIVTLNFAMPVERVYANPAVRQDFGCVAIQRGPVVYCLEEADNADVWRIALPKNSSLTARFDAGLLGGVSVIEGEAVAESDDQCELYSAQPPTTQPCKIKAVPYCTWANRGAGAMKVWISEA